MKNFFLRLLFPKFCLGCQKQGIYLCQDCEALIDIVNSVSKEFTNLSCLYWAADYENFIVKKIIQNFKYKPFVKDLAKTLALLIIIYFQNLEKSVEFLKRKEDFLLVPIPLSRKRLKWRGFNQAEEIAKQLSGFLEIPMSCNTLIKTKNTMPQLNLPQEARKENVKGAFSCEKPEIIKHKKILLIDDVFTTGSTLEEAARILKGAGARDVQGIVVARG